MSISNPSRTQKDDDHDGGKEAHPSMSQADVEELQKLDAAVDRIFKAVPEHPYILSAPCDEPRYHYPSQQEAESWARNTPFSLDEERLQYMTFLYREPTEGCFVVRSHVDEERDRLASLKRTNGDANSATNSPLLKTSLPRKKITLGAYKSKVAEKKALSPKNQVSHTMEEKKKDPKPAKSSEREVKHVKPAGSLEVSASVGTTTGQKRHRNDSDASKSSIDAKEGPAAPSVKKVRVSPVPTLNSSHDTPPASTPHNLPPLLSPTFLNNKWDFPPMLSPTLPPSIVAALDREEKLQDLAESNTSSSSSGKPRLDHKTDTAFLSVKLDARPKKEKTPDPKVVSVAKPSSKPVPSVSSVSHFKKDSMAKLDPSDSRKISDQQGSQKVETEVIKPRPSQVPLTTAADSEEKSSLVVRLKYGKRRRQQVERILRLPPRPIRDGGKVKPTQSLNLDHGEAGRVHSSSAVSQIDRPGSIGATRHERPEQKIKSVGTQASKEAAKKVETSSDRPRKELTTPEKKRQRLDDNPTAPSAKRQKVPAHLDAHKNPRTPIQSSLISPSVQNSGSSGKSSTHLTPRDGRLKPAATARSTSNETPVSTPGGKAAYLSHLAKSHKKGPTSVPTASKGSPESTVLLASSRHFNALGRKLKHANAALLAKPKDEITEADRKHAALLALECILSYMLAYALGDAAKKIDRRSAEIESTWLTLLPLFKQFGYTSTGLIRHLEGLRYHLGVAICARIQTVLAERMSRPKPSTVARPSATPSQEGREKSDSPTSSTQQDQFNGTGAVATKIMEIWASNWQLLANFSHEAGSKLPVDTIISAYPKTWNEKATSARDIRTDSLLTDDHAAVDCLGKFWLPISVDTTPIQAVRFGLSLLKEWVQKEGLEYEFEVKL